MTAEAGELYAIVAATGTARARLIDEFYRSKLSTFRSIANLLCRKAALDVTRHADDVVQLVAIECMKMIDEVLADPSSIEDIVRFDGRLHHRARPAVRTYADGAASGEGASGATAKARRVRELSRTRAALRAELNAEPTDVQVVEETNARMRRLRKDPARQSMICSMDDLTSTQVTTLDDEAGRGYVRDEPPLARHETHRALSVLADRACRIDPALADVAMSWLGGVYDEKVASARTVRQIATDLSMPRARVEELMPQVMELARQVMGREFGIWQA